VDTKTASRTKNAGGVGNEREARKSKQESEQLDKIYDFHHKLEQASDVVLPRVLENMIKPNSGCHGSLMLIQGTYERRIKYFLHANPS
jgi:hypothetical protein